MDRPRGRSFLKGDNMTVSELLDRVPSETTISFYYEDKDTFDIRTYIDPIKVNLITITMPESYMCLSKTFINFEVKLITPLERGHLSVEVYHDGLVQ